MCNYVLVYFINSETVSLASKALGDKFKMASERIPLSKYISILIKIFKKKSHVNDGRHSLYGRHSKNLNQCKQNDVFIEMPCEGARSGKIILLVDSALSSKVQWGSSPISMIM